MSLQEIHHGANMLHFSSFLSLQNCSHRTEDIFSQNRRHILSWNLWI